MRRKTRMILAMTDKLVSLLDIHADLFLALRESRWGGGKIIDEENIKERVEENEQAIFKVKDALNKNLG